MSARKTHEADLPVSSESVPQKPIIRLYRAHINTMAEPQVAHTLVLVRHGESQWNKDNRFTGWADVELSEKGHEEGKQAGLWLKEKGIQFDVAYTSVLKRAIQTLWHVLEETDQVWLPVNRRWRLNERMYGALQGLNKSETAAKHGEEQVCDAFRMNGTRMEHSEVCRPSCCPGSGADNAVIYF
jgi:hypothetical protein